MFEGRKCVSSGFGFYLSCEICVSEGGDCDDLLPCTFVDKYRRFGECVEKKKQLDVTECFIALMIRSTCFGHFYAHHQELETMCVLLPPMVCSGWLLVVRGQVQDSRL